MGANLDTFTTNIIIYNVNFGFNFWCLGFISNVLHKASDKFKESWRVFTIYI